MASEQLIDAVTEAVPGGAGNGSAADGIVQEPAADAGAAVAASMVDEPTSLAAVASTLCGCSPTRTFGASSIDIEVVWWTEPRPGDHRKSRAEVVTAIKAALDHEGIEIPYPYRTLVFKQDDGLQQLSGRNPKGRSSGDTDDGETRDAA